jgi:hypothetical protein
LQLRAAALVRETIADQSSVRFDRAALDRLFAHLHDLPCPGLAEEAVTRVAVGDESAAGETYLLSARECHRIDDVVAAAVPLRNAGRCADALPALREAWAQIDHDVPGAGYPVLDAIATCSDALTIREHLSFLPADTIDSYLAVRNHPWRR